MAELDLRKLWKLHLVDHQLQDIRQRAAALDPGRKIQSELAALTAEFEVHSGQARALAADQTDMELQQRSIDEKIKRMDKDLYGGKVVNPREVEAMQKEIHHLKTVKGDLDLKILELWDKLPPIKKEADALEPQIREKKAQLAEFQKKVMAAKEQMEKEYKERSELRPRLAKEIPAPLLERYELIRKKHEGVGMAGVTRRGSCEACGTNVPTKSIEMAKEGKLVTCEACHRILYASDGLI
jgi:predicted  nucleic acid-binding Zn-ribbon protein